MNEWLNDEIYERVNLKQLKESSIEIRSRNIIMNENHTKLFPLF